MKMWPVSPGAVTILSGDVSVGPIGAPVTGSFVPLVTSSIPTLGPKLVIGANRVLSYGFHGGCATAGVAAATTHAMSSSADNGVLTRMSIIMLLARRCTSRRSRAHDVMVSEGRVTGGPRLPIMGGASGAEASSVAPPACARECARL